MNIINTSSSSELWYIILNLYNHDHKFSGKRCFFTLKYISIFIGIALAGMMVMGPASAVSAGTGSTIQIDGVVIASDVKPEAKNGRIMVPLRMISENLGAKVNWSASEVTLIKNQMRVDLKLDSSIAVKNGESVQLDVKPYLKSNRILVPLRFIAETFGGTVSYNNATVSIDTPPFLIDQVEIKALQHEYHMTMGGVVQQVKANAYHEAIYNIFVENKGNSTNAPAKFSWGVHDSEYGSYYKIGQYDFLNSNEESVQQFDLYTLVKIGGESPPESPEILLYDGTEGQWYLFNAAAKDAVFQMINRAAQSGFLTVISNTVP